MFSFFSVLDLKENFVIYGDVNLNNLVIILDLNFIIPPLNQTTLIRTFSSDTVWPQILLSNSPPLPCGSTIKQTLISSELILKVTSDGCGGSIDDSTMKIGAIVGEVLLIVVCV
eukprot:TRINITY_DN10071_c0_g1_i1.p1 TRINITY_DN10071_c0_g1~~TRINITY_DN10071_c0_g1_i1.p1  ORF type:complete len:114 (+),score=18.38 TRINITY_DN10071_c0_g1_i1:71-412(+)